MMLSQRGVAPLHGSSAQSGAVARRRLAPCLCPAALRVAGRRVSLRAQADDDDELEERLKKLRQVKGATPYGEGKSRQKREGAAPTTSKAAPATYDFSGEVLHWSGGPTKGDLALNVVLGATLVWLPLTAAAVGRVAFVKYRFTDRRFSVVTDAPWKKEQTDVAYQEVKDVVTVGRGLWGDLVVTLRNGDKVELRSLDNFLELKKYILERRDVLSPPTGLQQGPDAHGSSRSSKKAGELTQAELLGEPEPTSTVARGGKSKGFA